MSYSLRQSFNKSSAFEKNWKKTTNLILRGYSLKALIKYLLTVIWHLRVSWLMNSSWHFGHFRFMIPFSTGTPNFVGPTENQLDVTIDKTN